MEQYTYKQAAKILNVTTATVGQYAAKKKLVGGRGFVTKESVDQYMKRRDPKRLASANLSRNSHNIARAAVDKFKQNIYAQFIVFYAEHGHEPTLRDMEKIVGLAPSGVGRYLKKLIEEKKLENIGYHTYPVGLIEMIKSLVKKEYADVLKTAESKTKV